MRGGRVALAGEELSHVSRLELFVAWRVLPVFEKADRRILLIVAQHTCTADPYQMLYRILGIIPPQQARTISDPLRLTWPATD